MTKRFAIAGGIVLLLVVVGQGVFWLVFDQPPPAPPPPPPATAPVVIDEITVTEVEGQVERERDAAWVQVTRGDRLAQNERVRTGEGGRAVLDVGEAATVEIPSKSQIAVREITQTVARVRLDRGRVSAVVHGEGGTALKIEAKDSDAVASATEGKFSVLNAGGGRVTVASEEGDVELTAQDEKVVISAGRQSVVEPMAAPAAPEPIPPSLFLKVAGLPKLQRAKKTRVKGKSTPGTVININDEQVTVNEDGSFEAEVALREGKNELVVTAEDALGRREEVDLPTITVKSSVEKLEGKSRWRDEKKSKVKW